MLRSSSFDGLKMKIQRSAIPTLGMDRNCDRISTLPDEVILHILSSLDLKQVIQTSFLSKRWTHLWKSLPDLSFSVMEENVGVRVMEENMDSDANFVDRVMILHTSNINKFSLVVPPLDENRIKTWIIAASARHTQEFDLKLYKDHNSSLRFPENMFNSDVKVVKLSVYEYQPMGLFNSWEGIAAGITESTPIQLPRSLCTAKQLQSLDLYGVQFPDGTCNGELIISCLALKKMVAYGCDLSHVQTFIIWAPRLEVLKLTSLLSTKNGLQVIIAAPNLKLLDCDNNSYVDYYLENLSALVSATISIRDHLKWAALLSNETKVNIARCLSNFLTGISNVQELKMSKDCIKHLTSYPDLIERLPQYHNLRYMGFMFDGGVETYAVVNFLKKLPDTNTPVLETNEVIMISAMEDEEWSPQSTINREYIAIQENLEDYEYEVKFLQLLLGRTIYQNEMILETNDPCLLDKLNMSDFNGKLSKFPRPTSSVSVRLFASNSCPAQCSAVRHSYWSTLSGHEFML